MNTCRPRRKDIKHVALRKHEKTNQRHHKNVLQNTSRAQKAQAGRNPILDGKEKAKNITTGPNTEWGNKKNTFPNNPGGRERRRPMASRNTIQEYRKLHNKYHTAIQNHGSTINTQATDKTGYMSGN